MVEGTGWRALLEKQGLHQAADIFEKYGIDRRIFISPFRRILFVVIESSFS
jgi:hypothetical protein